MYIKKIIAITLLLNTDLVFTNKIKIIIDTDPGADDAIALIAASNIPMLDILAVTTVYGNSTIENTTRNAEYILNEYAKRTIPVYTGAEKPLKRSHAQDYFFGTSGLGSLSLTNPISLTHNASKKMIELVRKYPHEVAIIALGPLTNIAQALIADPEAMKLTQEIIILGGNLIVPGNITPIAEFNIYLDPEAAEIVFNSPIKKILIPLDVINATAITWDNLMSLVSLNYKKLIQSILDKNTNLQLPNTVVADPLAIYVATHSIQTHPYHISVITNQPSTCGKLIAKPVPDTNKNAIQVVTNIQPAQYKEFFIATLGFNKSAT